MLFELILREEERKHFKHLIILGILSSLFGFILASIFLPSETGMLSAVFGALPLIYPLMETLHEDEKEGPIFKDEIKEYASLFIGETAGFFLLAILFTEKFSIQISRFNQDLIQIGLTGSAINPGCFPCIILSNITLFFAIIIVAMLVGSAGAFILTWNASVLGVFLAILTKRINGSIIQKLFGTKEVAGPIFYTPHATLEMTAFIIAGVSGSLMSAAIYRNHYSLETWKKYFKLVLNGVLLLILAATVESL